MIAVIDIETSGSTVNSGGRVIEVGIIKFTNDFKVDSFYHNYYMPDNNAMNYYCLQVHKLSITKLKELIIEKQKNNKPHPIFFEADKEYTAFMKDVDIVYAHNAKFEKSFLPLEDKEVRCTMKLNNEIVKATNKKGAKKVPNLKECADFYGVAFDKDAYHSAIYDAKITAKVIAKMIDNNFHTC